MIGLPSPGGGGGIPASAQRGEGARRADEGRFGIGGYAFHRCVLFKFPNLGKALADVRKAMNATQQDVTTRAAMTQNTVSKIESAEDVLISSAVRYMHSIGGGVELVLKMSDGKAKRVDFDPEIYVKQYA